MATEGVLLPFSRRVDLAALGHGLVAFISLSISQTSADLVRQALLRMPEVVEVHDVTGDADLLAHLRSAGPHVRGCWALDVVLAKG